MAFVVASGCSQIKSPTEHANAWIGRPLEDYRRIMSRPEDYAYRIRWKEKTYRLPNGNMVFVVPDRPECLIHFEVDSQGTIIGHRLEGGRCY